MGKRILALCLIAALTLQLFGSVTASAQEDAVQTDPEAISEDLGKELRLLGEDVPADANQEDIADGDPAAEGDAEEAASASDTDTLPTDPANGVSALPEAPPAADSPNSSPIAMDDSPLPQPFAQAEADMGEALTYGVGEAVSLLPYATAISGASGTTGLGLYSYSHDFDASDGDFAEGLFLNPIYKDADGTEYIVISSKAQLEAIGTGKKVVGAWATLQFTRENILSNWTYQSITDSYVGDMQADTLSNTSVSNSTSGAATTTMTVTVGVGDTGKTYGANENYLFVNDIDLEGGLWTPWDYHGRVVKGLVTLENGTTRNPVIANFSVVEDADDLTTDIDNVRGTSQRGVGFFGAVYSPAAAADVQQVTNERPWWDLVGNLLIGVVGLVTGLLKTLGGLVTDVVGLITGWSDATTLNYQSVTISGLTFDQVTVVSDGLYQTKDKTNAIIDNEMPVGTFAGQITGDVTVTNCTVTNAHTLSATKWVGGFVGKTVGATNYLLNGTTSGLSNTLTALGGTLDSVLNFLLPTDDLVSGLVSGLGVDKLIPTKYVPVELTACSVSFAAGDRAVLADGDFAGGFAGRLQGTTLTDCRVDGVSQVAANANVGGFAGRVNNAQLVGLLQGIGVNLINFPVGSTVTNCTVSGDHLAVQSTGTETAVTDQVLLAYAGGFAGAVMASDVVYDGTHDKTCGVTGLSSVTATGSYVGGFAGYAGVGDVAEALNLLSSLLDLNFNLKSDSDGAITVPLGTDLSKLLDKLLGVNLNAGILSLIGLNASQLVGCRVEGTTEGYAVTATDGDRVGGFVGYLHGGRIAEQLVEESYDRVQATDGAGTPLYVGVNAVTTVKNDKHQITGAIYARIGPDGTVIYEDVHGQPVSVVPISPDNTDTIYNIYDNVFINLSNKNTPTTTSTFRYADWSSVVYTSGDNEGSSITIAEDLPGYMLGVAFPVYQQTTTDEGYVQFAYNYTTKENGETVAKQVVLFRATNEDGTYTYYERGEDGTLSEFTGVNTSSLSVEALQVATDDSMEQTASGTIVTTYLNGLKSVEGNDYVGGVVGQAKLCSAADLLSNLTVVQYERFELNNIKVNGISTGYTVTANAGRAGGAVGYAMGGDIVNVHLKSVGAVRATTYAGGFGGEIIPGTVAGQDGKGLELLGLISIGNLLTVVDAVHTFLTNCTVTGATDGFTVQAQNTQTKNSAAGGFVGWSINSHYTDCQVSRLTRAEGDTYAGGFAAVADTGSIAGVLNNTFGGLDLSRLLGLSKLLSLLDVFPNQFTRCTVNTPSASGNQELAYTVRAASYATSDQAHQRINAQQRGGSADPSQGSAGGFLGYGTAVQIDSCANETLQAVDATSYAGGFGGFVEIGSVAQLGNAGILGAIASVTGLATLLDCAASSIKSSHCQGTSGGYAVTAFDRVQGTASTTLLDNGSWTDRGIAGGFVGNFEGSHIEGSYANHIDRIQGEEYAGGFAGRMVPGDIAKLADGTSLIGNLIHIDGGLLGALQVMVPSIQNSYAKCVPCGGTVTAYGTEYAVLTKVKDKTGVAGGFVGLNAGGQIWGNYDKERTVYQKDDDGNWGKITLHTRTVTDRASKTGDYTGNAGEYETAVYGTEQTCDILQLLLVDATLYTGGYSGYTKAADLASLGDISLLGGLVDLGELLSVGQVVVPTQRETGVTGPLRNTTQAQMAYFQTRNAAYAAAHHGEFVDFTKYYGYTVGSEQTEVSGGYCGIMTTGVLEDCLAYDLISSTAIQQSGGFVGAMLTGGVAQADLDKSLLGGLLSGVASVSESLLGVLDAIIPVIRSSGVYGYYSGSHVTALSGSAGGFAGTVKGGQIWGEADAASFVEDTSRLVHTYSAVTNHCFTKNLRGVSASGATADTGGFVGYMGAVSIVSLGGLGLLGKLVSLPSNLVSLISATVPTVYYAETVGVDDWGFRVLGEGARSAGGFAGYLQGAQVGVKDKITSFIEQLKDTTTEDASHTIQANISVENLRTVWAGDYAGGFFGYADAADTLNIKNQDAAGSSENFTLLSLLSVGQISALELAKSYIYNGAVSGIPTGYSVSSANAYAWKTAEWNEDTDKAANAGGFGGLLQAGVVRYCAGNKLDTVSGKNYAGGFVGRMGKSSILKVGRTATTDKLGILGGLLGLGVGVGDVFGSHIRDSRIDGIASGYTVRSTEGYHNIAGGFVGYSDVCRISDCIANRLRLVQSQEIAGGFMGAMSDATLLNLDVGVLKALLDVVIKLDLIKANRSKLENVSVIGVNDWDGYDVYGGGSTASAAATNILGYTGAFIGLNTGSTITDGTAVYADTVKGTLNETQPYIGTAENTALLANLQISVLNLLPELKGWLSQSTVEGVSTYQTRSGNTPTPSVATPVVHAATTSLSDLSTPYQVSAYEADLLMPEVSRSLTLKKELRYEDGAIPNLQDLSNVFVLQLWKDGALLKTARLHAGESVTYENLEPGTYTVTEDAAAILPGNIHPSDEVTVVLPEEGAVKQSIVNTVLSPPENTGPDTETTPTGAYGATAGKYIVNHIPVEDSEPETITSPCALLDETPAPTAQAERGEPLEAATRARSEELAALPPEPEGDVETDNPR